MPTRPSDRRNDTPTRQAGMGTFAMVGILIGIGVVFLGLFIFATTTSPPSKSGTDQNQQQEEEPTDQKSEEEQKATSKEPPFIRVPENSLSYKSDTYKFSFAYPNNFSRLNELTTNATDGTAIFSAKSAPASKLPVGNSGAILTGEFGVHVYKKDDFKIVVGNPQVYVSATKTGNDTTWKIVSLGATSADIKIGDSYPAKVIKSQTGVTVFDFSLNKKNEINGRYVFESGEYYILIAMPSVTLPSGTNLSDRDVAAYNIIGRNLASTVRVRN